MGQMSTTFSKQTMEDMKQHYQHSLKKAPPHALFSAKTPNAVITAFHSGKVLFQGKNPASEAVKWDKNIVATENKQIKKRPEAKQLPSFLHTNHIGSDESGTGDYFGPVTACAVYIREDQIELLKKKGIQDSKAITDKQILKLSHDIVDMNIPYSLMILHNKKYNDLQSRGWSQGKLKAMLHDSCIDSLLDKIGDNHYEGILIDQFCKPDIYKKHLAQEGKKVPNLTHFMTKAESYSIAVATASIIARASFVNEMDRLSNVARIPLAKGASHKVDSQAAQLMQSEGKDFLYNLAKMHFANTEKAAKLI